MYQKLKKRVPMKFFLLFIFFIQHIYAANNVGIILKKQGHVEILSNPSKKIIKKGKTVLYEGTYYNLANAKPGMRIQNGNILRTGNKSKAKIVYKNGDQFNIGEGTAYEVLWKKDNNNKKESSTTVNLIYGTLRGIVSKKGPRNNMKVKSRNAVMGVRGTDFHISQKGTSGETSVTVIRGEVKVTDKPIKASKEAPKEIKVKQGFSALVKTLEARRKSKVTHITKIDLNQTTKNQLVSIHKDSKVKPQAQDLVTDKKMSNELKKLEKKAVDTTLEDIKEYQPAVYEKMVKAKVDSIDKVNATVVAQAFKVAPKKREKKSFDDLEIEVEDDAYDKYFSEDE